MKQVIALVLFVFSGLVVFGQCSTVSVQVSSSDTAFIQLYHAGFFNISSGFDNVCEWEVTDFSGEIIYQDTTSGDAFEQGQVSFDHSIPLTDSMKATIIITNNTEGIICTINDTLYWEETEVLPGAFIGGWEPLSSSGGVEAAITSSGEIISDREAINIFPSPVRDFFQIEGPRETYSFNILDLNGRIFGIFNEIVKGQEVNIPQLPPGIYFVQFRDENNVTVAVKKFIKQ